MASLVEVLHIEQGTFNGDHFSTFFLFFRSFLQLLSSCVTTVDRLLLTPLHTLASQLWHQPFSCPSALWPWILSGGGLPLCLLSDSCSVNNLVTSFHGGEVSLLKATLGCFSLWVCLKILILWLQFFFFFFQCLLRKCTCLFRLFPFVALTTNYHRNA